MDRDDLMRKGLTGHAFRIILALEKGENYNSELARMTGMKSENTHKTILLLKREGFIEESHRIGRNIFYRLV